MPIVSLIERLGAFVIDGVSSMGDFIIFLAAALFYALQPPYKVRLLIRQMRSIGAESFFLVGLIGLFTGMVLGLQGYNTLSRFGSEGALGTVVALVLVRELGPVLAALMVAARAGSAMAAELGSMQATEQIDALTTLQPKKQRAHGPGETKNDVIISPGCNVVSMSGASPGRRCNAANGMLRGPRGPAISTLASSAIKA